MAQKYRKKPVVIEAIQFYSTLSCIKEIEEWGLKADLDYSNPNVPVLKIPTLEGVMNAIEGDYIIKGIRGEFYPCKADIFLQTYERVE